MFWTFPIGTRCQKDCGWVFCQRFGSSQLGNVANLRNCGTRPMCLLSTAAMPIDAMAQDRHRENFSPNGKFIQTFKLILMSNLLLINSNTLALIRLLLLTPLILQHAYIPLISLVGIRYLYLLFFLCQEWKNRQPTKSKRVSMIT